MGRECDRSVRDVRYREKRHGYPSLEAMDIPAVVSSFECSVGDDWLTSRQRTGASDVSGVRRHDSATDYSAMRRDETTTRGGYDGATTTTTMSMKLKMKLRAGVSKGIAEAG
ncbi:hypothetical protein TWF281_009844 [Arthrobotrys megalospora]